MLNCGAIVDLGLLFSNLPDSTKIYVVDAHRPYHLSNVRGFNQQVNVLHDSDDDPEFPDDEVEAVSACACACYCDCDCGCDCD
jgi:hypothetical protein